MEAKSEEAQLQFGDLLPATKSMYLRHTETIPEQIKTFEEDIPIQLVNMHAMYAKAISVAKIKAAPRMQMKSYGAEMEAKSDKTFMQFGNLLAAAENIYLEALAKGSSAVRSN